MEALAPSKCGALVIFQVTSLREPLHNIYSKIMQYILLKTLNTIDDLSDLQIKNRPTLLICVSTNNDHL